MERPLIRDQSVVNGSPKTTPAKKSPRPPQIICAAEFIQGDASFGLYLEYRDPLAQQIPAPMSANTPGQWAGMWIPVPRAVTSSTTPPKPTAIPNTVLSSGRPPPGLSQSNKANQIGVSAMSKAVSPEGMVL